MQKILAELSAAVGPGQAIEICRRWPGRRLQVPTQVEDGDPLVLAIGMDVARELVRSYGGRRLELPTERNALRSVRDEAIRRDRAAGMSHERLGAAYGLTRQAVAHILKKSIPRTDGESDACRR